ncbi:MAG: sulfoxide reductase heme-binding subunit YedZ [Methylococcaceae bacterium]|nr:sulfoxide reductase heme-binding subunit YedZ [Methylococcaceae bacterium]
MGDVKMLDRFKRVSERTITRLKALIFLLALWPLAKLMILGFQDDLGANPIEKILRNTGFWTLTFLTITMAITPLRQLTQRVWLGRFRRMLGLFAFFYGVLHFSTYLVLDQFFDWANILKDISKRPYITVGFSALVLMTPLAVTSTDAMLKRLGGKRWRQLHQLVYLITAAGVIHFWWLVKKDISEPLIFAALLALSLTVRAYYARQNRVNSAA